MSELLNFKEINSKIDGADAAAISASRERWSQVAKPLLSLGAFEDLITQIAGVKRAARFSLDRRVLVVFCADNGVIARGVTQTDESVTSLVAADLAKGCSSANLMANVALCDVIPIDVGMKNPKNPSEERGVIDESVARGTHDFTIGPAMSREQALQAMAVGLKTAEKYSQKYDIICSGEMGIGNTTTAAAVASVLLGCEPSEITGRGAGLSTEGLERKIEAIRRGIAVNSPDAADPLGVLAALGGFDIAAMAGLFIGGALHRVPIVIDGVISAVAALVATRLCPSCSFAMLPSHASAEPAAQKICEALQIKPVINAGLHLGEGTGALCLLPLLDMAMSLYNGLVFSDIGMEAYTPQV